MRKINPHVIILAGPNGAGKTTVAPALLQGALSVSEFVNADIIAQGLSVFNPEKTAFQAGRMMLKRLQYLADERASFAFETTLASRSFAPWLRELCNKGYLFHLMYFWIPNAEFCIKRVEDRVAMGGHHVPAEVIRRRYSAGLRNFFELYISLASSWRFYNNANNKNPSLIAAHKRNEDTVIYDQNIWDKVGGKI